MPPAFLSTLGPAFGTPVAPSPGPVAVLVDRVDAALSPFGWNTLDDRALAQLATGAKVPPDCASFASVYAGHQFGVWARQLGDGRALSLCEAQGFEAQLKGAGPTPYSRFADGRAVLRSCLREMWGGEWLHALGVPTTRCGAVAFNGLEVARETFEPGATVLRTGPCFVRPGHFEFHAFLGKPENLRLLVEACAKRWFPPAGEATPAACAQALLIGFAGRTGTMIGAWMAEGFVHGVMNTDNFALTGETLDFGPFAVMERFDPAYCPNHTDTSGRYAWQEQPRVGAWNLSVFAATLESLLGETAQATHEAAQAAYGAAVQAEWDLRAARKLGFAQADEATRALAQTFLGELARTQADYHAAFRALAEEAETADAATPSAWHADWQAALVQARITPTAAAARIRAHAPVLVPRLHLLAECIRQAEAGDRSAAPSLRRALADPCRLDPKLAADHARWEPFNRPQDDAGCALSCSS